MSGAAAESFDDDDLDAESPEIVEDFAPVDTAELALGSILAGITWVDVATEMGVSTEEVVTLTGQAAGRHAGPWSPDLTRDVAHAALTAVTKRVHDALAAGGDPDSQVALIRLLIDATRLRAELAGILPRAEASR